jgi:hypothetical protein
LAANKTVLVASELPIPLALAEVSSEALPTLEMPADSVPALVVDLDLDLEQQADSVPTPLPTRAVVFSVRISPPVASVPPQLPAEASAPTPQAALSVAQQTPALELVRLR